MNEQTQLFPNARDVLGLLCLQCVIESCDENDPRCLYSNAAKKVVRPDDQVKRGQYFRAYYQVNKERINKVNGDRQKESKPWKKRDRSAYFKARYRERVRAVLRGE